MKVCLGCEGVFASSGWRCPACGFEPERHGRFWTHAPEFVNSGGGFKPEYFSTLSRLESKNFWFRARNELLLALIAKYSPEAKSFLEVGCGTGFVLSGISKARQDIELYGSEIFLEGLSYASERLPDTQFMQMDARRIPFHEEFDAIGAFDVLEHIEEDNAVLVQLSHALRPGGVLYLTVPQHPWLWSASDDYAMHVRRYARHELERKVLAAGFAIERTTSFVSLLLPLMLAARLKKISPDAKFDPTQEFRLHKYLNASFLFIMRLERTLISLGLNFPLGGSRVIVARKPESSSSSSAHKT